MNIGNLITLIIKSFVDVLKPRVLRLLAVPFLGSFLLWSLITWLSWGWITSLGLRLYDLSLMQRLVQLLEPYFTMTSNPLVAVTAGAIIFVVILPAALVTAILLASAILIPVFVSELRRSEFPNLKKASNSILSSLRHSLSYSVRYLFVWIGTLPFWISFPIAAIVIPYVLLSWFNSRVFSWEALMEISSGPEAKAFMKQNSRSLFWLGILTTPLYYIPLFNLLAPVFVSSIFTRYCVTQFRDFRFVPNT